MVLIAPIDMFEVTGREVNALRNPFLDVLTDFRLVRRDDHGYDVLACLDGPLQLIHATLALEVAVLLHIVTGDNRDDTARIQHTLLHSILVLLGHLHVEPGLVSLSFELIK